MKFKFIIFLYLLLILFGTRIYHADQRSVFISEIFPDAIGADSGNEWIELYNNSDAAVDLTNWVIVNQSISSSSKRTILLNQTLIIPSKQYFIISESSKNIASENIIVLGSGKISMYNDASTLTLMDSSGNVNDAVTYPKPTEGKSMERRGPVITDECQNLASNPNGDTLFADNFNRMASCWGGEEEPVSSPVDSQTCYLVDEAKLQPIKTPICIQGVVNVDQNILGDKIYYLQSNGSGIKIKLQVDNLKTAVEGDNLKLYGELRSVQDGLYFYVNNIEFQKDDYDHIEPLDMSNLEKQKYLSVLTKGIIVKNYSKSFDIDTGKGIIRVSVLSSTGIEMPERSIGDNVTVSGILIKETGAYKVLPRYSEDIVIEEKEIVEKASAIEKPITTSTAPKVVEPKQPPAEIKYQSLPNLKINYLNHPSNKTVTYKISKGIYFIIGIFLWILLILFVFRKRILNLLKTAKIKIVEVLNKFQEINSHGPKEFHESNKYEVLLDG